MFSNARLFCCLGEGPPVPVVDGDGQSDSGEGDQSVSDANCRSGYVGTKPNTRPRKQRRKTKNVRARFLEPAIATTENDAPNGDTRSADMANAFDELGASDSSGCGCRGFACGARRPEPLCEKAAAPTPEESTPVVGVLGGSGSVREGATFSGPGLIPELDGSPGGGVRTQLGQSQSGHCHGNLDRTPRTGADNDGECKPGATC